MKWLPSFRKKKRKREETKIVELRNFGWLVIRGWGVRKLILYRERNLEKNLIDWEDCREKREHEDRTFDIEVCWVSEKSVSVSLISLFFERKVGLRGYQANEQERLYEEGVTKCDGQKEKGRA